MKKGETLKRWADSDYLIKMTPYLAVIAQGNAVISGVDLAGISIGADSTLPELLHKDLFRSSITDSCLRYARISGGMSESLLDTVDFSHAILDRCVMLDCRITSCNFSAAKLVVKMNDTICEDCCFTHVKMGAGSLGLEYGGRRVRFIGCDFSDAVFNRVEFRASSFINCIFNRTRFIKCDFRGVKAEGGILPVAGQFELMDIPSWVNE